MGSYGRRKAFVFPWIFAIAIVVAMTGNRTGMLACAVSVIIYAFVNPRGNKRFRQIAMQLAGAALFITFTAAVIGFWFPKCWPAGRIRVDLGESYFRRSWYRTLLDDLLQASCSVMGGWTCAGYLVIPMAWKSTPTMTTWISWPAMECWVWRLLCGNFPHWLICAFGDRRAVFSGLSAAQVL